MRLASLVSSSQFLPRLATAFLTVALEKLVPLPSQTNLVRWQSLPASVGELELLFK